MFVCYLRCCRHYLIHIIFVVTAPVETLHVAFVLLSQRISVDALFLPL